jgi:hypothetical protein
MQQLCHHTNPPVLTCRYALGMSSMRFDPPHSWQGTNAFLQEMVTKQAVQAAGTTSSAGSRSAASSDASRFSQVQNTSTQLQPVSGHQVPPPRLQKPPIQNPNIQHTHGTIEPVACINNMRLKTNRKPCDAFTAVTPPSNPNAQHSMAQHRAEQMLPPHYMNTTKPPPHTHTCTHLSCASCRVALGPSRLTHNRQQACCYAVMCCASTPVLCPEPQTQPAHSRGGGRPAAASSPGTEAAPCYCCRASTCRGINMNMDVTDTST